MTSIISPDWPAPSNVVAGTTTRNAEDGLLPRGLQYLNQVHGAVVVEAGAIRDADKPLDADAITRSGTG